MLNKIFKKIFPNYFKLQSKVEYLESEVSELQYRLRHLANNKDNTSANINQTKESFSSQWSKIPKGKDLIGDEEFESNQIKLLSEYTSKDPSWFKGKKVLDAGCGNGRWSYLFHKLGAEVTSIDQSLSGIENVRKLIPKDEFRAIQVDILNPQEFNGSFDFVWSYGVTHHTGNTQLAVKNISNWVRSEGFIFLMIYGEPTNDLEYKEVTNYIKLRQKTRYMSFDQKVEFLSTLYPEELIHPFFDAISPEINDLHSFEEISGWLNLYGFKEIIRTIRQRNHHVIAKKV